MNFQLHSFTKGLFWCLLFTVPNQVYAQITLTESTLLAMSQESSPTQKSISASESRAQLNHELKKGGFSPQVYANYSYASSKEDAIIRFIPVFRPQKNFQLGLRQKSAYGTQVDVGLFTQQLSTADGFANNASQVGAQIGLEVDLWKNFLGRLDKSDLQSQNISSQIAKLQANVDRHSFSLDLRKIYWSLIANELSLSLSKQLVATSKKQLSQAKRRARDGLGDSGAVARQKAQLSSKNSSQLFFSYQKELLLGQLRSLLPKLKNQEITIPLGAELRAEKEALRCMSKISATRNIQTQTTHLDEIIQWLEQKNSHEYKIASSTSSMDIKLQAKMQTSGVDSSYGKAYDSLTDQYKNGYQVGVALQIPLGSDLRNAEKSRIVASRLLINAQKEGLELKLQSEQTKVKKSIAYLLQASQSQDATVVDLKTSLKSTQKKYRQARVSLSSYLLEQDNLFSVQLQNIDTKRQILHLLLDYFKIFTSYPCDINHSFKKQSGDQA